MKKGGFYITTAIDYVNGRPHLGHAYEKIGADVMARYKRLQGFDTLFLIGSDEHSLNVARKAEELGVDTMSYCDEMAEIFKDAYRLLNISYDRFIRTTDEDHAKAVQEIVKRAWDKGYIYRGAYSGWYCPSCEAFMDEDKLVDRKCPVHTGKEVEWVKEDNFFFALSKFEERLIAHIEANPGFILPESRRNEVVNRIREGLKDISISRSTVEWGIPLPMEPSHVVYVWFDALINYVTGAGYPDDKKRFGRYWPADYHIIGKDITWFHCVIWPAVLMAVDLPLPKSIFAHGFINMRGEKLSKSEGNAVDPFELVERFGVDAVRYYLMRAVVWGGDGDFSVEGIVKSYNADLANDFGNLLSRCTAMIDKYFGGVIPAPGDREAVDDEISVLATEAVREYEEKMERMAFSEALASIWRLIGRANKYIDETAPWELAKREENRGRLGTVMYTVAEVLRIAIIAVKPFLVDAPPKFWYQLGLDDDLESKGIDDIRRWGGMPSGVKVRRGEPIFPRLDPKEILSAIGGEAVKGAEKESELVPQNTSEKAPGNTTEKVSKRGSEKGSVKGSEKEQDTSGFISIDEFAKVDLRIARVLECEKVEKADKLLKLRVSLGSEERTIVTGLAGIYKPEELVGRQIVMVANLEPAKIRGIESRGMLLTAESPTDGNIKLLGVCGEVPDGSRVR